MRCDYYWSSGISDTGWNQVWILRHLVITSDTKDRIISWTLPSHGSDSSSDKMKMAMRISTNIVSTCTMSRDKDDDGKSVLPDSPMGDFIRSSSLWSKWSFVALWLLSSAARSPDDDGDEDGGSAKRWDRVQVWHAFSYRNTYAVLNTSSHEACSVKWVECTGSVASAWWSWSWWWLSACGCCCCSCCSCCCCRRPASPVPVNGMGWYWYWWSEFILRGFQFTHTHSLSLSLSFSLSRREPLRCRSVWLFYSLVLSMMSLAVTTFFLVCGSMRVSSGVEPSTKEQEGWERNN